MTQAYSFIRLSTVRHVGWLEYNRPPVNAFTRAMVDEVYDAIGAALEDPDVRVLVLASAVEGYFSAGADLHDFKGMTAEAMHSWANRCHDIARRLRDSPKPLLAAIPRTAVGGGLEMTLHCDLRFAASDARLGQPEVRIGFIPPIATTQSLARLIGRPRTPLSLMEPRSAEGGCAGPVDKLVGRGRRASAYGEARGNRRPWRPSGARNHRRRHDLRGGHG